MTQKVTWKSVQDRYKRLQDDFDRDDMRNGRLSGVAGGEMGELYQALSQMREERESFVDKKQSAKNEKARKEEEKELMGKKVVEMALLRNAQRSSDEESGLEEQDGSEKRGNGSARNRQRWGTVERVDMTSGLAMFAEKLKDADLARVKLDEEALQFEKHKHDVEISERQKDREERRIEREQANKLKLEKFNLMMDMLSVRAQVRAVPYDWCRAVRPSCGDQVGKPPKEWLCPLLFWPSQKPRKPPTKERKMGVMSSKGVTVPRKLPGSGQTPLWAGPYRSMGTLVPG